MDRLQQKRPFLRVTCDFRGRLRRSGGFRSGSGRFSFEQVMVVVQKIADHVQKPPVFGGGGPENGPPRAPSNYFEVFLGASLEETSRRGTALYLFHGRAKTRCGSFPRQGCGGPSRAPAGLAGGNFLHASEVPFASSKPCPSKLFRSFPRLCREKTSMPNVASSAHTIF